LSSIIEHFNYKECYFVEIRPNKKLKFSGNSSALPKSSEKTKKRGNSKAVGSKKKSINTYTEIEESMEGLENLSWT
jgi:hypothetical protein